MCPSIINPPPNKYPPNISPPKDTLKNISRWTDLLWGLDAFR